MVCDSFVDDRQLIGDGEGFEITAIEARDLDCRAKFVEALFEEFRLAGVGAGGKAVEVDDGQGRILAEILGPVTDTSSDGKHRAV